MSEPRKRPRRQVSNDLRGTSTNSNNQRCKEMEQSVFRLLQSGRGIIVSGAGMSVAAGLEIFSNVTKADDDDDDDDDELHNRKSTKSPRKKKSKHDQKKQSSSSPSLSAASSSSGLYHQAAKKLGIKDGMEAFRFRFLNKCPSKCFHLLECLYGIVSNASPTLAHQMVHRMGDRVLRHYTLNIDGLAKQCPQSTNTTEETNPPSNVVELHGSLHELVCRSCAKVYPTNTLLTPSRYKCQPMHNGAGRKLDAPFTSNTHPPIPACPNNDCNGELRFRVLLYEELEGHLIYGHDGSPLESLLPQDLALAQWMVWVGISFRQQASCDYFAKTLQYRGGTPCPIVVVDPRVQEVIQDLETVVGNPVEDGWVCYHMAMTSDEFFSKLGDFFQEDKSRELVR